MQEARDINQDGIVEHVDTYTLSDMGETSVHLYLTDNNVNVADAFAIGNPKVHNPMLDMARIDDDVNAVLSALDSDSAAIIDGAQTVTVQNVSSVEAVSALNSNPSIDSYAFASDVDLSGLDVAGFIGASQNAVNMADVIDSVTISDAAENIITLVSPEISVIPPKTSVHVENLTFEQAETAYIEMQSDSSPDGPDRLFDIAGSYSVDIPSDQPLEFSAVTGALAVLGATNAPC